jgi:membrane-associated HD superfamily phosphohydrolase
VERRVAEAAAEGQLDECELTMGELDAASRALAEALLGIYRDRPAAPQSEPGAPVIQLKARP